MRVSRLLGAVLGRLYRLYYRTLRIRVLLADGRVIPRRDFPFRCEIFALSERDALAFGGSVAGVGMTVMVAHGRDGDVASAALETIGCAVVRGSSRRGGASALSGLIRSVNLRRQPLGLVVDGPLGPVGKAKPGVAFCAIQTRRPLRAVGAASAHAIVFAHAWSQIFLPLPFSRLVLYVDDPIDLPDPDALNAVDSLTREVTLRLARARALAFDALTRNVRIRQATN